MDKEVVSFEMGERLKKLRVDRHLSYKELAEELMKKYEVKISKDSLRDYEIADSNHSKAKHLPNMGMRTEYLYALAQFYGVSTDYLLGISPCMSQDVEVLEIMKKTGLSERSIGRLTFLVSRSFRHKDANENRFILETISDFISDLRFIRGVRWLWCAAIAGERLSIGGNGAPYPDKEEAKQRVADVEAQFNALVLAGATSKRIVSRREIQDVYRQRAVELFSHVAGAVISKHTNEEFNEEDGDFPPNPGRTL